MTRAEEKAIALAGLVQCCALVDSIAKTGLVSEDSLAGSLESILVTDPKTTEEVYASGAGIRTGLRLLLELFGDFQVREHGETFRYVLAIISLEKKLRAAPALVRSIGAGIERMQASNALQGLPVTSDDWVQQFSDLYQETAGCIEPRVRVQGRQKHLQNPINTSRIRALLLAALRAATLWRQLGGHLLQLALGRKRLLRAAHLAAARVN